MSILNCRNSLRAPGSRRGAAAPAGGTAAATTATAVSQELWNLGRAPVQRATPLVGLKVDTATVALVVSLNACPPMKEIQGADLLVRRRGMQYFFVVML